MGTERNALRTAKKLRRLRLVERSRAALEVSSVSKEVLDLEQDERRARSRVDAAHDAFVADAAQWHTIAGFEAALEHHRAEEAAVANASAAVEKRRVAQRQAMGALQQTEHRLSAADAWVTRARERLHQAMERLEQTLTDDLSTSRGDREP